MPIRDTLSGLFDRSLEHRFAPDQRDDLVGAELGGNTTAPGQYLHVHALPVRAWLTTNVEDTVWQESWAGKFSKGGEARTTPGPVGVYIVRVVTIVLSGSC